MYSFRLAASAVLLLVFSGGVVSANVITDTESFGPASTNWGTSGVTSQGFTPSQAINFTGFDTSLGTLTSLTISVAEAANASVNVTNNGTASTPVDASLLNRFRYTLPSVTTPTTLLDSTSDYSTTLAPGASSGPQAVAGSVSNTPVTVTGASLALYTSAWSALVGDLGTVSVSAGNSNGSAVYTDQAQATISVAYTYTPAVVPPPSGVPEPATLLMLGSSFLCIGALRRRR